MPFAETERLIIRGSRDSDADAMLALLGDIRYRRSGPVAVVPPSEASLRGTVKAFNEKLLLLGVLEAKEGGAFVGLVTLLPEGAPKNRELQFGVELVAEHEGKGYATEATRWTVNHAFIQLNAQRVSLQVLGDNTRALALYKKIGFVEEGRDREANFQDGKWSDNVRMAILDREWKAL